MKKIAIITFILFLCSMGFYITFKPNNVVNNEQYHPLYLEHPVVSNSHNQITVEQTYSAVKNDNPQGQNKAYIEIKKDAKTGEEKAIVQLPKGKRLFDEESLKEISRDATI